MYIILKLNKILIKNPLKKKKSNFNGKDPLACLLLQITLPTKQAKAKKKNIYKKDINLSSFQRCLMVRCAKYLWC